MGRIRRLENFRSYGLGSGGGAPLIGQEEYQGLGRGPGRVLVSCPTRDPGNTERGEEWALKHLLSLLLDVLAVPVSAILISGRYLTDWISDIWDLGARSAHPDPLTVRSSFSVRPCKQTHPNVEFKQAVCSQRVQRFFLSLCQPIPTWFDIHNLSYQAPRAQLLILPRGSHT